MKFSRSTLLNFTQIFQTSLICLHISFQEQVPFCRRVLISVLILKRAIISFISCIRCIIILMNKSILVSVSLFVFTDIFVFFYLPTHYKYPLSIFFDFFPLCDFLSVDITVSHFLDFMLYYALYVHLNFWFGAVLFLLINRTSFFPPLFLASILLNTGLARPNVYHNVVQFFIYVILSHLIYVYSINFSH